MSDAFTKHKEGSVRQVWALAYPMILAFLSGNLMTFADRLFLAHYATAAMNAAAAASIVVAIFQYGSATITSIAEVFVGKFNGAKNYRKVASPVWQMLWFSLGLLVLFCGVAKWGGPYLLPSYHYSDHGLPYFQWLLYFGAATPAIAALTGFFVGIGRTRYVLVITVLANLLNIALDPLLIFGVKGWLAPMGAKGAAVATGISLLCQLLAFGGLFLSHKYREKYGTALWCFDSKLFKRCLKVGVPNSLGHMVEWSAWAVGLRFMAVAGEHYLTVAAVGHSMYSLVAFAFEGVQKSVTTLAANRIGAGAFDGMWRIWRSGVKLLCLFALPIAVLMLGFPEVVINQFISSDITQAELIRLLPLLRLTAAGVFLYYLLDGLTWITVGMLTAAEDTWFVMWVNAATAWACGLAPIFVGMVIFKLPASWYFFLLSFYGLCNASIFYWRFKRTSWQQRGMAQMVEG